MTRLSRHLALAGLLVGACNGLFIEPPADCAGACALADDCGFLPSSLGDESARVTAEADCVARCEQSPADDAVTARVIACLAETTEDGWCADENADTHPLGRQCAAAAACLDARLPGAQAVGPVSLDVALISFTDFIPAFGSDALVALYTDTPAITACAPALCDADECKPSYGDPDRFTADVACDETMCGRDMFQIATACEDLAAASIELTATQDPARLFGLIAYAGDGACTTARVTFKAEDFDLRPGPIRTAARISGTLAAADLEALGQTVPAGTAADALLEYCLELPGMQLTARSGGNRLLVPIGTVDEIAALALTPTPCGD